MRVGRIGFVSVAAPWRERKIVGHERAHVPVVRNLRRRGRVVGLDQRKRHAGDVVLDVAVAVERHLRGIFFSRVLKALRPFNPSLRINPHPKAMRDCEFCRRGNVTRVLRDVIRTDDRPGLQFRRSRRIRRCARLRGRSRLRSYLDARRYRHGNYQQKENSSREPHSARNPSSLLCRSVSKHLVTNQA